MYYERPGLSTLRVPLKAKKMDIARVVRHYTFITEFMWSKCDMREDGRVRF